MLKLISHIVLSSLLLLSSTGVKINLHFCQDHLYDLALNTPAHSCCSDAEHSCSVDHNKTRADHCADKTIKVRQTDNYLVSGFYPGFENTYSNDLFFFNQHRNENRGTENAVYPHLISLNKPPPGREVFLSRIQSFLI